MKMPNNSDRYNNNINEPKSYLIEYQAAGYNTERLYMVTEEELNQYIENELPYYTESVTVTEIATPRSISG